MTEETGILRISIGEAGGGFLGHRAERSYLLNIHQQPVTREVTYNDASVPLLDDRQSLDLAPSGWWWDNIKEILTIKLPRTAKGVKIDVR